MICSKCGKEINNIEYLNEDKEPICIICASKMTQCKCGLYTENDYRCKNCSELSFERLINPYSTKIKHIFKNKECTNKCLNKRYYGLELEYNYTSPALLYYKNKDLYKNKLIYNKTDRSIGNGVEINIVPSDYSSIKKIINNLDLLSLAKVQHVDKLYDNAGIHIHVSSNSISSEDKTKLNLLFNNKFNEELKEYIYYISGRINNLEETYNDAYYKIGNIKYKKIMGLDHYCAINFKNESTVEFRLFGSTVLKEKLLGYIEFVNLALEFVNKNPIEKMKIINFLIYIKENAKTLYNRTRISKIEKEGLVLNKYEKINFSYRKLIELFKNSNKSNAMKTLSKLSSIPLNKVDDRLTINNIDDYGEYGYKNDLEEILRKRIIDKILNKEAKECV